MILPVISLSFEFHRIPSNVTKTLCGEGVEKVLSITESLSEAVLSQLRPERWVWIAEMQQGRETVPPGRTKLRGGSTPRALVKFPIKPEGEEDSRGEAGGEWGRERAPKALCLPAAVWTGMGYRREVTRSHLCLWKWGPDEGVTRMETVRETAAKGNGRSDTILTQVQKRNKDQGRWTIKEIMKKNHLILKDISLQTERDNQESA